MISRYPQRFIFSAALALLGATALSTGCNQVAAKDEAPKEAAKAGDSKTPDTKAADAKGSAPKSGAERGPAPVKVTAAVNASMPTELENIATVESISTVEVKAQASGAITDILFKEGDYVTEGQELFRIDARPYEATLKQLEARRARAESMLAAARAAVTRDKAQASNMQTELQRNKTLLDREMVTRAEYDTARTQAEATKATVDASAAAAASAADDIRAAEADIENAKLSLAYCIIRSPMNGRTGALQIHKGDIVKANDASAMVTITQLKPIYVSFTLAERYLAEIRQRMQAGALSVSALVPSQDHAPADGQLTFVDNQVDKATSTIRLKATFPNDDEYLWPGQYVRASMQMSVQQDAIVVPSQAVQTGQKGTYVYVIGAEMKAELRPVKVGADKDGLTAITEGLKVGESVVVDGQMRVAPGQPVSIITGEEKKDKATADAPPAAKDAKP